KIVQVVPGLGEQFYCENCVRDMALVKALRRLGHEVLMVPMYLPVTADEGERGVETPIFFGGINVYLQQKSRLFRRTPRWLDELFDSPWLLRWAGRRSSMTSSRDLAETTISMLQGREGRQVKELNRLLDWLAAEENRPDVVVISNVLMAGLARPIRDRLGAAIVCMLQDEDSFLDGLGEPYGRQAWQLASDCAHSIDAFISTSDYYAKVMQGRLQISGEKVHSVYMGIDAEQYEPAKRGPEVPTIGYLSRACYDRGLDTLVEAFVSLKKDARLKGLCLRIAGGSTGKDKPFLNWLRGRLAARGLLGDVDFLASFGQESKVAFLQSLSVLSVPEKKPIAYGMYVIESLACGVPVVEPAMGALKELIEATGGGVLFESNNAATLAATLKPLLLDPDYGRQLGQKGRQAVLAKFTVDHTAQQMVRIFEGLCSKTEKSDA
ncbi:MAG: glycosyltransferase family 4 protein, partial [Planctomycetota bacterium]